MERVDKEDWLLQDVIFVEDSRNIPVGKVLKVGLLQYVQKRMTQSIPNHICKFVEFKSQREKFLENYFRRLLVTLTHFDK